MPRYTYIAKPEPHKTIQGELEADSEQDAVAKLTRTGLFPISLRSEEQNIIEKKSGMGFRKISKREIVLFTRQLASLIESGVNLLNGLMIVSDQIGNKYLKAVIKDVIGNVKDGKPFSESLSEHPAYFSNLYTSMIRSGEVGGSLQEILKRLADFLEKEEEFKNSLRAALTYPAFVFSVGILTVAVLLGFVIPRLVTMFEDMGQALPLPTKILINLSIFLRGYWWLIIAAVFIFIFLLKRSSQKPQGKLKLDALTLKLPLWGQIIMKTEISRLMRTLSLLLSSGITIVYSLDIAESILDNQVLKDEIKRFKEEITSGSSFSQCLKDSKDFPSFVTNIVTVGEETGSLDKALFRIAEEYERDVDRSLKTLARMIEPVIILLMGLIVGFIVLSMLLPIFQINLIAR